MNKQDESGADLTISGYGLGSPSRPAWIIDGAVENEAANEIYGFFKRLPYVFQDFDRSDTQMVRHLVHTFPIGEGEMHPLIRRFSEIADDLFAHRGIEAGPLLRSYANFNLNGDIQFTHDDGDEWTLLFFVNAEWREDWSGELLLYDDVPSGLAIAVSPRPGRAVLFDGLIPHRGGVPSKLCFEPRITLAMKFARGPSSS